MADVSRPDRGQMLVITALIIATVLVGLALVINGGIYTENLATRETGSETSEAAENRQLVAEDLQELIDKSNAAVTGDDYTAVKNGYDSDLALWSDHQEERYHRTGRFVEYEQKNTVEGTRIQQTNASRNFTAGGTQAGTEEWSLANETTEGGEFDMDVDRTSLLSAPAGYTLDTIFGETFHVVIENETGHQWRVYLFQDDSVASKRAYVMVEAPGGFDFNPTTDGLSAIDPTDYCTTTEDDVSLDLIEGTFDGSDCSDLEFYTDNVTGTPHNISYRNTRTSGIDDTFDGTLDPISSGDRVVGTYNLTVNKRVDRSPFYDPTSGDSPNAKAVIFKASVTADFRSNEVVYRNEELKARWSLVA